MSEDLREKSTGRRDRVVPDRPRLLLASFLMLFVELALIRWTASNNLHLAYLTNFVLLASFLGIGIGFLRAGAGARPVPARPGRAGRPGRLRAGRSRCDRRRLTGDRQLVGRFGLRAAAPVGDPAGHLPAHRRGHGRASAQGVARAFARFQPLEAYRLDILGSIAGIVAFSALAFLQLPPLAWGLVAAAAFVLLLGRRMAALAAGPASAWSSCCSASSRWSPVAHWSPYYKVRAPRPRRTAACAMDVKVNNVPHQTAHPVRSLRRAAAVLPLPLPAPSAGRAATRCSIVGAGTGNDVAVALAQGAKHIDAVEIDPVLQQLGRDRHPDRPVPGPAGRRRTSTTAAPSWSGPTGATT